MKDFIELSPSLAKDIGYLQIREMRLKINSCHGDHASLKENVYTLAFLDKVKTWIKVCNQSKQPELHESINSLLF